MEYSSFSSRKAQTCHNVPEPWRNRPDVAASGLFWPGSGWLLAHCDMFTGYVSSKHSVITQPAPLKKRPDLTADNRLSSGPVRVVSVYSHTRNGQWTVGSIRLGRPSFSRSITTSQFSQQSCKMPCHHREPWGFLNVSSHSSPEVLLLYLEGTSPSRSIERPAGMLARQPISYPRRRDRALDSRCIYWHHYQDTPFGRISRNSRRDHHNQPANTLHVGSGRFQDCSAATGWVFSWLDATYLFTGAYSA